MESGEITGLLRDAANGNEQAFGQLVPLVYAELRGIAHGRLRLERSGHTLDTTALVHEAYLKLAGQTRVAWQNRSHFFAVASEAMRRILIDYAKQRRAAKRGDGAIHLGLDDAELVPDLGLSDTDADELIALDDALHRLLTFNPQGARIVQYRFFGGMAETEIAEVLGISERTVRRSWTIARAWLRRELDDRPAGGSSLLHQFPA